MRSTEQSALGVILIVVMLTLTGCVTTTGSAVTSTKGQCAIWEPIRWSTKDTEETILEIKAHNAVGKSQGCW